LALGRLAANSRYWQSVVDCWRPTLLLLDEPSVGLSSILVEQIFDIIQDTNEQGTSILLVEQNDQMALAIADRAYVLENGKIVMQGTGDDLLKDTSVIEAYLGGHWSVRYSHSARLVRDGLFLSILNIL